ncbi:hypothetical protein [Streptomyces aureus]|uniref:hypothetical protein n=1 Tax=Streptomyces aureus TaxID=193461 RepID=UPI00362BA559
MLTSTGFHAAATVVLAAGTRVPKLCEPLSADLAIAASPATLARVTAPPGLVKTIVAGPDFEVREVREGDFLLVVPHVEGTAALERSVQDAFQRMKAAFKEATSAACWATTPANAPCPRTDPSSDTRQTIDPSTSPSCTPPSPWHPPSDGSSQTNS